MKIANFSSGSCGNVTLVRSPNANILVDVGISKKAIVDNLAGYNLTLEDIDAVLITHEHTDHIKAFGTLLKTGVKKYYMTLGTYDAIYKMSNEKIRALMSEKLSKDILILNRINKSILYDDFQIGDILVKVIPTFHDALESVGFVFENENKKLVYITDTGYVHHNVFEMINNAECYVLESNHDPELLRHSPRPYHTIVRILSDHGHLSNEDSAVVLASVMGDKTKLVMHAHISQECNLTQILTATRDKVLSDYGLDVSGINFVILSPLPSKEYEI